MAAVAAVDDTGQALQPLAVVAAGRVVSRWPLLPRSIWPALSRLRSGLRVPRACPQVQTVPLAVRVELEGRRRLALGAQSEVVVERKAPPALALADPLVLGALAVVRAARVGDPQAPAWQALEASV